MMEQPAPKSDSLLHHDKDSFSTGPGTDPKTMAPDQHSLTTTKSREPAPGLLLQTPSWNIVRPLSPDTVSNLSVEEYGQLNHHLLSTTAHPAPGAVAQHSPPQGWRTKLSASWKRNKGLFLMLVAQVFGTMMNVTIRLLEIEGNHGRGMHPIQILFARMTITFSLASGYMWWHKTPDFPFGKPEVRWLLVTRGFGGFFGVFGMYYSLLYLPLADATVITFLAPSLACWACSILINEPFTRIEQIGGLVSMVGVVLIARPTALFFGTSQATSGSEASATPNTSGDVPGDASNYDNVTPSQRLIAVGVSLVGVLGAATAYTTIRWIGKRAHPLISVNYFSAWSMFVSAVAQIVLPGVGFLLPATLKDWAYLIFLGICGFIMQFLLAAGLSYEKSSRSTNMAYTQMLFALTFDKLVFNHSPGWISIVGSSLILGPAIIVALQKDAGRPAQQTEEPTGAPGDEESRQGLMAGAEDGPQEMTVNDRLDVHDDVQLRSLR